MLHPLRRNWRGFVCAAALLIGSGAWAAEDFKTQEYWNSTGLDVINAASAYEQGYTGKGVILGIADCGMKPSHREFAGKELFQVFADGYVEDWKENDHGSHVAGIMAANRDGSDVDGNMQGVAFDAGLTSAGLYWGKNPGDVDEQLVAALEKAFSGKEGVKAVNNSWGYEYVGYYDWLDKHPLSEIVQTFKNSMGTLLFSKVYDLSVKEGKLMVCATGNSANLGAKTPVALPSFFPEAKAWISVMSLNPSKVTQDSQKKTLGDGAVANSSNLAFGSEEYSLLAPGVNINSVNVAAGDESYMQETGTSMAAPYVTGAAGLVQQAYPWMSGKQLADTLLSTADRSFNHPDFHVAAEEMEGESGMTLRLRLLFIGGENEGAFSEADIRARLARFYESDSADLKKKGIDSLETLLKVYDGTVDPEKLLDPEGRRCYVAVLPGDAQAASFDQVYGQGILDVGKAVRGPSQLNMNRLSTADVDAAYKVPLYEVDFDDSYGPSVFANDIEQKGWIVSHHLADDSVPELQAEYAAMSKYDKVGFLKDGTGTLFMTGRNTYEGPTVVRGGVLSISKRDGGTGGELVNSDVYVEKEGRLQGNGVIQNAVTNEGTVAPGNSIGTLTVGSYVQSESGVLELEWNAAGHDQLIVTGSAVLKGTVKLLPGGYLANGEKQLNLSSFIQVQGSSLDTRGLTLASEMGKSSTLSVTSERQGTAGFRILVTRAPDAYSRLALTPGAASAGRILDQIAGNAEGKMADLIGALDFSGAASIQRAMDQLHPEAYDSLMAAALGNNQRLSSMVAERLTGRYLPAGSKTNWYFQPFGSISRQNGWDSYGGYKSQSSGVLIGGEKQRGDWTLGVHGGFIHDSANVWGGSSLSSTSDGGFIGLHAKRAKDPEKGLFVYGLARAGWDHYDATRTNNLSAESSSAKWTGFSGALEIGAGWNHKSGKTLLTPVAALNYAIVTRPGISESGGFTALVLDSADYQSLRSSLGVKVSFMEGRLDRGVKYAIDASALWRHEFLDDGPSCGWRLGGASDSIPWRGAAGRDSLALNLGAEFGDRENFSVKAAAGTELFRPGFSGFMGSLKLEWKL